MDWLEVELVNQCLSVGEMITDRPRRNRKIRAVTFKDTICLFSIHESDQCNMFFSSKRYVSTMKRGKVVRVRMTKEGALHQGIEPWSPALDEILLLTSGNHDH